jgi:ABC-type transporter Mla maintaining outer membrane lipid asymmetry ATPase subunit MlaF
MEAPALLSARGLKRSVSGRTLWSDVSFDLHPGEILFVRGPSGVGKSLLLRALACLDVREVRNSRTRVYGIPCCSGSAQWHATAQQHRR